MKGMAKFREDLEEIQRKAYLSECSTSKEEDDADEREN